MGTNIHWTDETWNPVTGCAHVSTGCEHCYAEALSLRHGWSKLPWTKPNEVANVVLHPDRIEKPLSWRKPRMVFVNSMSDLWHDRVPFDFIRQIWAVMAATPQHTYQILTKRPERMAATVPALALLPNVWLGVSIEQDRWCQRADVLRDTPAGIRFISAEPLLEGLPSLNLDGIHWLIAGGESGPDYRPMQLDWARDLRDRCKAAGVAYFFKQAASIRPGSGRMLDGRKWEEYPA